MGGGMDDARENTPLNAATPRPTSIAVFGDSWAVGDGCWPFLMAKSQGLHCSQFAMGGTTSDDVAEQVEMSSVGREMNAARTLCILHTGGNDLQHHLQRSPGAFLCRSVLNC